MCVCQGLSAIMSVDFAETLARCSYGTSLPHLRYRWTYERVLMFVFGSLIQLRYIGFLIPVLYRCRCVICGPIGDPGKRLDCACKTNLATLLKP